MLLLQGRGEVEFLPSVTAVLLHHSVMDYGLNVKLFVHGRGELSFLLAVTAILLHQISMDIY